ncbi:MAG TPA: hypothetical protein VD948_08470 [Rhodothermales bacterium]|nr:hypothetical protein [Rhodothermales bacterium]
MKRLLFLSVLAGVALGLTGCFERDPKLYDGPRQVEFAPVRTTGAYARTITNAAASDSLVVQLIEGEAHTEPITVNFVVRDTTIGTSQPARSGTDYTLVDNGSVTIQPGRWSAPLRFNVLRNAAAATTRTMIVELTGNEAQGVIPAANYKRFVLTFNR